MKNLKKPARLPRKAPSNQTGGTAWGKKLAAEISRMAQRSMPVVWLRMRQPMRLSSRSTIRR